MSLEFNMKSFFQDFNPSKFVVFGCLMLFCLLFALHLDGFITCSLWIVFLPLWLWKGLVIAGAIVGSYIWVRHPHYRTEGDSKTQYQAMTIATSLNLLLLIFELLACDKLENKRPQMLWILISVPLFCISISSIGLCVWALKHGRSFELELFFSVNILQFIFLALRLDEFVTWRWVIVFIPIWIVMCIALVGVIYAIIAAIIIYKSSESLASQRRGNMLAAVGYTLAVVSLLVFEILLVNKLDGVDEMPFIFVMTPLLIALCVLMLTSFGARSGNYWWFGVRKEFCCWLLDICPLLQEYGNISYKMSSDRTTEELDQDEGAESRRRSRLERLSHEKCRLGGSCSKKHGKTRDGDENTRTMLNIVSIELPD